MQRHELEGNKTDVLSMQNSIAQFKEEIATLQESLKVVVAIVLQESSFLGLTMISSCSYRTFFLAELQCFYARLVVVTTGFPPSFHTIF